MIQIKSLNDFSFIFVDPTSKLVGHITALLILIHVASAFLLWELAVRLLPAVSFEILGLSQTIFVIQATGIAILSLLGDKLGKTKGFISVIHAMVISDLGEKPLDAILGVDNGKIKVSIGTFAKEWRMYYLTIGQKK